MGSILCIIQILIRFGYLLIVYYNELAFAILFICIPIHLVQ